MNSSICIVLMVVFLLCLALLLAWLAAREEQAGCIRLTLRPPEMAGKQTEVTLESKNGAIVLTMRPQPEEDVPCGEAVSRPAPADGEDLV
ncbi:MAG: hypothetical protein LKJ90_07905 [Faecalibacterium sp.]|nr:hypothetical protein [Faecalibacterium sp.]